MFIVSGGLLSVAVYCQWRLWRRAEFAIVFRSRSSWRKLARALFATNCYFSVHACCHYSCNTRHLPCLLTSGRWLRNFCSFVNPLTPDDNYSGRTAPLTSKRCILCIYSTNIGTEYFNTLHTLRFFPSKCSLFHNSNVFGSCVIHILYIYSTNIGTEYFKHGTYPPFFSFKMQFVS